jgi:hypothetical protein
MPFFRFIKKDAIFFPRDDREEEELDVSTGEKTGTRQSRGRACKNSFTADRQ